MGQKRARDPKGQAVEAKKRKKGAKVAQAPEEESWDAVGVDDLNWKEVAMPDRMEDAEGFFGLEEIDGVDIIRPQGNGTVQFKAKSGKSTKSILRTPTAEETAFEEWSGFSDGESTEKATTTANEVPEPKEDNKKSKKNKETKETKETKEAKAKETKESKKKETKPKDGKNKNAKSAKDSKFKANISFEALEEADSDDEVDVSGWDELGLSPEILTSLSKLKFGTPSAIQKASIPPILDGHDVVGKASTGSGKTLAFGIPILEHYLEKRGKKIESAQKPSTAPMALILSPTRELAVQLSKHIGNLITNAPDTNARIALVTGGLAIQKQQRQLATADIVIGTPGRVWEILSTGSGLIKKMKKIRFLVVDEADRLLSQGNFKEVEEIIAALDRQEHNDFPEHEEEDEKEQDVLKARQTLVFSATFHKDLQQKLAGKSRWTGGDLMDNKESMEYLLKKLNFREEKPRFIDVNPVQQMAEGLKEGIVECPAMEKDLYLYALLLYYPKHRTLVFTNSISAVRRVTQLLQALGLPALGLHSSMAQKARLRSVERFSSPTADPSSILVATDVAARGLDIKGIEVVVHYHAPRAADSYVHRSGRTARAGAVGKSVIICSPDEVVSVARLAAKVHARNPNVSAKKLPLESLEIDRRVVARVKPRITLAKKLTDVNLAKEKVSAEDNWMRSAAEDLGVEYDSDDFDDSKGRGRGRGGGRERREKEDSGISKAEMGAIRAELKGLLSQRINIGVSERYLTAGRVDIEALLRGEGNKSFLGHLDPLGF
ncbi:ATP-dependent RNA helicase mak5 [Penicillium lividum]|nr:ATP-dependent RNA helicase mak5 [Penicillium lividum]